MDNNFVGDIDKAIEAFKNLAVEQKKIIDTGITSDGTYISELYCDDTEAIDECMDKIAVAMKNNYQIVSWLEQLKTLRTFRDDIYKMVKNTI